MAKNGRFWHKKWIHFAPARISAEQTKELSIKSHLGPLKKIPACLYIFFFVEKYVTLIGDRM